MTIAVIDTGIDVEGKEFAGRISNDSKSFAGILLSARATAATTRPEGGSDLLRFSGPLTARSPSRARGVCSAALATLGLSSPLRVERARATVLAPVGYDLMTCALSTERASVDLTPTARELDIELGWRRRSGSASPAHSTPGTSPVRPTPRAS